MDKLIKIVVTLFVVIAAASAAYVVYITPSVPAAMPSAANASDNIVYYFYGQGCPHCAKIEPFMENITKKYPDIDIRMLEVWYNQIKPAGLYTGKCAGRNFHPSGCS